MVATRRKRGNGNEQGSTETNGSKPNSLSRDTARNSRNGGKPMTYEEIMMGGSVESADAALAAFSARLKSFREWLIEDAKATVHPSLCIVNGEATDGTKNAPVLVYGESSRGSNEAKQEVIRLGAVDHSSDRLLYDRTIGCQVRAVKEIKADEIIMEIPRGAMISPDLVASSDAGKAVLACCRASQSGPGSTLGFWDSFENTTVCEQKCATKIERNSAPQLLVKILQERKRVVNEVKKALDDEKDNTSYTLCEPGEVSTRAPVLAFLIQQRFSNSLNPPVAPGSTDIKKALHSSDGNALQTATPVSRPPGSPNSFAPYCRTLPSSVALPMCWERSELALLSGCIPGIALLQDVGAKTLQLAAEFLALTKSGILDRFPQTFPPGLLTWERWVWAASISCSRLLPATMYIDKGCDPATFAPENKLEYQSPAEVWTELGVMVPLLDMLNHEVDAHQVTWAPPEVQAVATGEVENDEEGGAAESVKKEERAMMPRAVLHKKVRKGSELFCCYGRLQNSELVLQYGFAQINNECDDVTVGWGLSDAVGHVQPPADFVSALPSSTDSVFASKDEKSVQKWWNENRVNLLKEEGVSFADESTWEVLKMGKKLMMPTHSDGSYDPILLTLAVVATMPPRDVERALSNKDASKKMELSKRHERAIRQYLEFSFTAKIEKLLQNLSEGLKGHFANTKLWTKSSQGGLQYKAPTDDVEGCVGWQFFFDTHAYLSAMEVEGHFYAMAPDSCVLTFYNGQLKALQSSLDGLIDDTKYETGLLHQLKDIGYEVSTIEEPEPSPKKGEANSGRSPKRKRQRKRSNNKDKPLALKLHIGNLSYSTTPPDLYEYFSSVYGKDNILECHIPVEKANGRSRGFGFVTMPEMVAMQALDLGKKHEVHGRILKLAKSNSAGAPAVARKSSDMPQSPPPDRCATCGYRPKYCVCPVPNIPGFDRRPRDDMYEGLVPDRARGEYQPPPYHGYDQRHREAYHHDDYRYGRGEYDYERTRSWSYERDYDRHRERSYIEEEDRYGSRKRSRSAGRSRDRSYERSPEQDSSRREDESKGKSRRSKREDHDDWSREKKKSRHRKKSRRRDRSRSGSK